MTSNWFTFDKPKVIQALRYHFISRKEIKIIMILVNVFALLSAALFYMKKVPPSAFLLSSFLWFSLMVLFWFLLPTMIYKRSKTFQDRFRVIINESEFTLENDMGARPWHWNQFSSWIESPHFFHLYFNSRSFFIIPKDAFFGDDAHEARNYFRKYIKAS